MFEKCHKCGQGGLKCRDDYASLKSGYWWEWRNETHKHRYIKFTKNLLAELPALDSSQVQYPYPVPTPYRCSREESCKGGFDSPCLNGYEGPLCAVCSSGFYKQLEICKRCPSKKWILGQLSIILVILLIAMIALAWRRKRKVEKAQESFLVDILLSKLKIVISFYQVTYGLLETFSYIQWPDSLQIIGKYSEILQLNILQIAPVHCLFSGLHMNAFGDLIAMMTINAGVIGISGISYRVQKQIVLRRQKLNSTGKLIKISQTKELVYRNVFFFLYATYLSTCSKTVNVLPLACRRLCRDDKEDFCYKYLKADYSIQCRGPTYNHFLTVAYISTAYIIALPVASFVTLWRQQRLVMATEKAKTNNDGPSVGMEMNSGLRFLYENYKARSWYWELIEMTRKVILTSGLALVGQESRSYIGLAWVIAGMYGMLFAFVRPIQDEFENRLMTTSLAVTVVNLAIGAVSRIPAENIPVSIDPYTETVLFKILVLGANTLVMGLLVGRVI